MLSKVQFGIAISSAIFLASCTLIENADPLAGKPSEAIHYIALDNFNIPISIAIPDSLAGHVELNWNHTFGRLEVSARAHIDFHIIPEGQSMAEKRKELAAGIFTYRFFEDNDMELMYSLSIPDGPHEYFHYFACFEIGGVPYTFETNPLVEWGKEETNLMRLIILRSSDTQFD